MSCPTSPRKKKNNNNKFNEAKALPPTSFAGNTRQVKFYFHAHIHSHSYITKEKKILIVVEVVYIYLTRKQRMPPFTKNESEFRWTVWCLGWRCSNKNSVSQTSFLFFLGFQPKSSNGSTKPFIVSAHNLRILIQHALTCGQTSLRQHAQRQIVNACVKRSVYLPILHLYMFHLPFNGFWGGECFLLTGSETRVLTKGPKHTTCYFHQFSCHMHSQSVSPHMHTQTVSVLQLNLCTTKSRSIQIQAIIHTKVSIAEI